MPAQLFEGQKQEKEDQETLQFCRPISVLALQSGSFSRRRNCLIHGSLVNSKTEIIGRLIMLGA